jgi:hypothetical protein
MIGTGYHGTLTSNVESILRSGLRPRGRRKSHDAYLGIPSNPEFVYLASSPVLAADHITRISERLYGGAPVTILSIDATGLNNRLVYPDEDWLSDEWNSDLRFWPHKEQLAFMRLHQAEWEESLSNICSIAYRGVVKPHLINANPIPLIQYSSDEKRRMWQERVLKSRAMQKTQAA